MKTPCEGKKHISHRRGLGRSLMVRKKKKTTSDTKKSSRVRSSRPQDAKTARVIAAVVAALVLVMIALACASYLFTGAGDQSVQAGERYANLLGKAGYYISYALMDRMGISTFFLLVVGFAIAAVVALDKPFSRIALFCAKMIGWGIWLSVVLAYFSADYSGAWGYRLNDLLRGYIGWGLPILLALLPIVWAILHYGITPEKLNQVREQRLAEQQARREEAARLQEEKEAQDRQIAQLAQPQESSSPSQEEAETYAVEEQQQEDESEASEEEEPEEIHPDQEHPDEEEAPEEEHYAIEDRSPDAPSEGLPGEGETLHEQEDGVECTMTVASQESELDDDTARRVVEQFGEYDPTLDLPGYEFPPIKLLRKFDNEGINVDKEEVIANRRRIVETLKNYHIDIAHIHSTIGPTVTLYEIVPAPGVRISKIKNLEDDIALSLSALGIRIIAPIPGKGTIGIEVPNKDKKVVSMFSVIKSAKFQESTYDIPVVLGKTIQDETFVIDLAKMPHLLVAGATGQGKSVGLNAIITSLLYKKHPSELKLVLVDPKKVELTLYGKLERHFLAKLPGEDDAIITDTHKVIYTLNSLCIEMDARYDLLRKAEVRHVKEYNDKFRHRKLNPQKGHRFLPYIIVVIDEFADLIMTAGREVETPIARIAQLARAVGIHLVIATQRPTTNIITGVIKANFPARIAFRVTSMIDSRTIIDQPGANQLIGRGDMLVSTGNDLTRVQCAFVDTPEIERITEFISNQRGYLGAYELPEYNPDSADNGGSAGGNRANDLSQLDAMFDEVAHFVVQNQQGSTSSIQRRFSIGYNRAGRIMDQLEMAGVVGRAEGSKPREVLIQDVMSLEHLLAHMND